MIRRLTCSLLSLVLIALWTAGARAADLPPLETEESGPRVPVLGFFLAFAFTVLTLVILCMPSRKS
jgi:hypothetical protein